MKKEIWEFRNEKECSVGRQNSVAEIQLEECQMEKSSGLVGSNAETKSLYILHAWIVAYSPPLWMAYSSYFKKCLLAGS